MAQASVSFDDLLQQSRQKRKAEQLAQEMFGKNRNPRTPTGVKPSTGGSLASRMGVNKVRFAKQRPHTVRGPSLIGAQRTSSLPRSNTASPRNGRRSPPSQFGRPALGDKNRTRSSLAVSNQVASGDLTNNPVAAFTDNVPELSIRGAAGGPHVVIAQNFAPGTTAADIESVMVDVGGQLSECRLIATNPTVIAEMTFIEKSGAERVIATFNNKKADGRTLHVYMKGPGPAKVNVPAERQSIAKQPQPLPVEDTMEVDENAEAREAENRLREERRGRPDRGPQRGAFPTGPRAGRGYEDDYYRGPRRAEPAYQDGRYGFGGGDNNNNNNPNNPNNGNNQYDSRGRFPGGGRLHSDEMRRGGAGWRR